MINCICYLVTWIVFLFIFTRIIINIIARHKKIVKYGKRLGKMWWR